MQRKKIWPVLFGLAACLLSLAFSIVLQRAGYLTYLNSDMASEVILAHRQFATGSPIQFDWLYSTEIHTIHMNLLYALAFFFTKSYETARILGNTACFVLSMLCLYGLLRSLRVSRGRAIGCAALLPFAASALYASNMTIGGYYIIHLPFAFGGAALWLAASENGAKRSAAAFLLLCLLEGFLSVRYVLCFVCPMVVLAVWELVRGGSAKPSRFTAVSFAGFFACVLGYAASDVLYPRLFVSGTGAASSFVFNPLDGNAMLQSLAAVFTDFLKLLGWRGAAVLFSAAGIGNMLCAAVIFFGVMLLVRALRRPAADAREERMLRYALTAFLVNLFCFVFIAGTYLNRYLILAVIFFIPILPLLLRGEENLLLRRGFTLLLACQLALSGAVLLKETRAQEADNQLRTADLAEAGAYLTENGYTRGYGTFWNVRVLEERTNGALTFGGIRPEETEEGAAVACAPGFIRWLEPDERSGIAWMKNKTFLLLTREEETQLSDWLAFCGAPLLHENDSFAVYGFDDSTSFVNAVLLGQARLTGAAREADVWQFGANSRLRIPTSWREAGDYALTLNVTAPAGENRVRVYRSSAFEILAEQTLAEGENTLRFTLPTGDKYFMVLIESEGGMTLTSFWLEAK